MQEFDYVQAHARWAQPQFDALRPETKLLYQQVARLAPQIQQGRATLEDCDFPATEEGQQLRAAFEQLPTEELLRAQQVIYYWGHWAHLRAVTVHYPNMPPKRFEAADCYGKPAAKAKEYVANLNSYGKPTEPVVYEPERAGPDNQQDGGAYWKFQHLARRILKARQLDVDRIEDEFRREHGPDTEAFMHHRPGTSYDNAELPALLNRCLPADSAIRVVRIALGNFRPHPYCIGTKHIEAATSGTIDDAVCRSVGCEHREENGRRCGLPPEAHTYDKVAVLNCSLAAAADLYKDYPEFAAAIQEHAITGLGSDLSQRSDSDAD